MRAGQGWTGFCQRLAELAEDLLAAAPDAQSRQLAEGYLARLTVHGLEQQFFGAQRLQGGLNYLTPRIGGYNPDYRMAQARLEPGRRYRLKGHLNDAYRLGIGVYSAFPGGRLQLDSYATQRQIQVDGAGGFQVALEAGEASPQRLPLLPTSNMVILRELDLRPGDTPAQLELECLDGPASPAPGPGGGDLALAGQFIEGMLGQFLHWSRRLAEAPNHMQPLPEDLNQAVRGDPGTRYYVAAFDLSGGAELDLELPEVACDYWGLALSTYWLEPLPCHLNHATARADPDGICRIRLARQGGGWPGNQLHTSGLDRGVIWYRTIDADRLAVPALRLITSG